MVEASEMLIAPAFGHLERKEPLGKLDGKMEQIQRKWFPGLRKRGTQKLILLAQERVLRITHSL